MGCTNHKYTRIYMENYLQSLPKIYECKNNGVRVELKFTNHE